VFRDRSTGHRHVAPDSTKRFATGVIHAPNEQVEWLDGLVDSYHLEVEGALNLYFAFADGAFFIPAETLDRKTLKVRVVSRREKTASDWFEVTGGEASEVWTVALVPR